MDALCVGAGAVGQVLALHLERGGARVSFLVKPAHADETRRGFQLSQLGGKRETAAFSPSEIFTSAKEAAAKKWDLIVLCVSSTALRRGPWLDELSSAKSALFVAIQPGLEDPAYVAERVGAERLVWGMFPLIAFADGDRMNWFRPPLGKLPFSGPRAREVAEAFSKGGLPARVHRDVPTAVAFSGALLELLIVALECAGWRFDKVGPELPSAMAGLREALAISARHRNKKTPLLLRVLRPWMIKLALPILRRLAPFAVEDYLHAHFTKVGDQTIAQLSSWSRHAAEYQLPSTTLDSLRERLQKARSENRSAA